MHDSTALTIFACVVKGIQSLILVDKQVYLSYEYICWRIIGREEEISILNKYCNSALRDRASSFKNTQKTKKDLRCTFITLYGVKANKHSGIVNDNIIIDDLFK